MDRIEICDVAPRDGLQNEQAVLPAQVRIELCSRLADAGLAQIEAGSFAHPERVPQMAGTEDVFRGLAGLTGVRLSALVLNEHGFERARTARVGEIRVVYPLTDTFAVRNQGVTAETAANVAGTIIQRAQAAGIRAVAVLGASFGCPFEGRVATAAVVDHAERMASAGAETILLADTIGVAVPSQVGAVVRHVRAAIGDVPVGLHLHNTRNTGYANAATGVSEGVRLLDAATGGVGGCPFAPGATGNIATEDLIYLLEGEGFETGINFDDIARTAEWLATQLGHDLPGLLHSAGWFPPRSGTRT